MRDLFLALTKSIKAIIVQYIKQAGALYKYFRS